MYLIRYLSSFFLSFFLYRDMIPMEPIEVLVTSSYLFGGEGVHYPSFRVKNVHNEFVTVCHTNNPSFNRYKL